ncbi:restriction endonuclease subunit S [uncultured Clostridium sp.]|uniref:restriction endonuclease subunit S n=1 Tax=uncultured Clostridium sp. TaxID=59620 RepID=UPI0025E06305|nr:restriction endonuclease subunit S [uncultured Clostridium sp.]
MDKNKANVPKIRFPGFTDPWEQRKYSDTFTNIPNNTLARAELNYNSGLAKNVHYGDVLIKFGELLDVEKDEVPYITDDTLSNKFKSSKLQNGDVIIADAAEDETVGKCTELVNVGEEIVISGLHTIPCRPTLSFASGYLGYFMNSPAYHNQLLRLMQGTKVSSISKSALQNTVIFYPFDILEQKKISELFQQLNSLITLHQRKLNHLKYEKKGLLQKMFPKNGENFPELRFPGFTDPWKQRKVKDIFKVTRGYVLAATETTDKKTDETPYPVYSSQTKDNGLLGYYKNFLYENAITWTTDGANAGTVNYRAGKFYCTNVCGVLLSDDGYANKMVSEVLNNISWKYVSKVGNPKLMNNVMSEIVILLPKTIEEQNTISDFLDRLDDLITLHQRKLNHLQEQKKALLQQMFI